MELGIYTFAELTPDAVTGETITPAQRLRDLFRITCILGEERPDTVRAWMIGSNPLLDDKAPIELLHEENTQPVSRAAGSDAPIPFSSAAFHAVHEAGRVFVANPA